MSRRIVDISDSISASGRSQRMEIPSVRRLDTLLLESGMTSTRLTSAVPSFIGCQLSISSDRIRSLLVDPGSACTCATWLMEFLFRVPASVVPSYR